MKNNISILVIIGLLGVLVMSCFPSAYAIVTVPGAPENLTATLISGTYDYELDWDVPANDGGSPITGYRIEISAANTYGTESEHWNLLLITEDDSTNYTHEQTGAYSYGYRVFAINSEGTGLPSDYANCFTSAAEVPSSIYDLTLTVVNESQINLSWSEPNDNGLPITGYKIEYKVNGVEYTLVENTGTTDTTYSHTGLQPDTTYYYKVYAINDLGFGEDFDWEGIKTLAGPIGLPNSPVSFDIYLNYGALDLRWEPPSYDGGSPIIGYMIEYRTQDENYNWTSNWTVLVENSQSTDVTYTHSDISPEIRYCYRISAINEYGTGPSSEVKCATPLQYEMTPSTEEPTPGFELILVVIASIILFYLKRKK